MLTKTDLAETSVTDALVQRLRRLNPSAPLWRAAEEPIDAAALLSHDLFALRTKSPSAQRWFAAELEAHAHPHDHAAHDPNRHDDNIHAFSAVFDGRSTGPPSASG